MHNKKTDLILDRMNKELEQQGKTQAELIAHLGLPKGTYTNWNLNRSRGFCEYIEEIASFLNVDIEWFITNKVDIPRYEHSLDLEDVRIFRRVFCLE